MKTRHPYQEYQGLEVWKILEKGIRDLHTNGDVVETTARPYIVGYLAKLLGDSGLLASPPKDITHPIAAKRTS